MLQSKEIHRLCDLVCDADQSIYMLYEQRRRSSIETGQPALQEPLLPDLSGESRKEIRRLASDPRLVAWFGELNTKFLEATTPGREGPLPPPMRELSVKEQERANALLSTKEHMLYAVEQILRTDALLAGKQPRPESATELAENERKLLSKMLRDRRMMAYVSKLIIQAEAAEQ